MSPARLPSVLIVEDDATLNHLLVKQMAKAGYEVASAQAWARGRELVATFAPDLVLLDVNLPDSVGFGPLREIASTRPVVMLTAYGNVHQAVEAMRLGAADYLVKPVNLDELELVIQSALERSQWRAHKEHQSAHTAEANDAMLGDSLVMQDLRQTIATVAVSDVSVLILGESGVGKELVAQALHAAGPRAQEPFVTIDCCTLQDALFESELFGHEQGAFSGADRRKTGLLEAANGGTLFLDEVGEASLSVQAKLLRVLETGRFRRLGANADLRADVRVIATSNRDLSAMVAQGLFRQDLFYRLCGYALRVPPLRQRSEDIALLARHFIGLRRQSQGLAELPLAPDALALLEAYPWPGNVRELRNVIERALILAHNASALAPEHIQLGTTTDAPRSDATGSPPDTRPANAPHLHTGASTATPAPPSADAPLVLEGEPTLEDIEREYLARLLKKYDGNRRKVAEALGVSERTAYRMLERHGYK